MLAEYGEDVHYVAVPQLIFPYRFFLVMLQRANRWTAQRNRIMTENVEKMSENVPKLSENCPQPLQRQIFDSFWTLLYVWSVFLSGNCVASQPSFL